ncbi:LOW QUALITY PROTEIN: hypothetical protein HZS_7019 [Henneguya salminicola]|nr:LOW QUALITY PROTEIN: hypothetical protein HZS_7019 [Henneguya salminicola]
MQLISTGTTIYRLYGKLFYHQTCITLGTLYEAFIWNKRLTIIGGEGIMVLIDNKKLGTSKHHRKHWIPSHSITGVHTITVEGLNNGIKFQITPRNRTREKFIFFTLFEEERIKNTLNL